MSSDTDGILPTGSVDALTKGIDPVSIKIKVKGNKYIKPVAKQLKALPKKEKDFKEDDLDDILSGEGLPKKEGARPKKANKEEIEYRHKQIHRLLMRGVPKVTISQHLNIPLATLYRDISAINEKIKEGVSQLDYPLFVGQAMAFFDEAKHVALRLATDTNEKNNLVKMRALDLAIRAEEAKHKYLQMVGLYHTPSPISPETPNQISDEQDFARFMRLVGQGRIIDASPS